MLTKIYFRDDPHAESPLTHSNNLRAEHTLVTNTEQEYRVIVLDADDTFDVIIQHPNDERECVFSVVKDDADPPEEAGDA